MDIITIIAIILLILNMFIAITDGARLLTLLAIIALSFTLLSGSLR